MAQSTKCIVFSLLFSTFCFLFGKQVLAQEISAESLRLPEVVITGTDQSKIQRPIPKMSSSQFVLPVVMLSSRDDSNAHIKEGDLLILAQARRAEEFYVEAITFDPTNSPAFLRLGDTYRALHRYEAAAQAYLRALEISENLLEAHYQLGILYESQLNDMQKAIEHYQAYLQGGGADTRIKIWLRNIDRGKPPSPQAAVPEKPVPEKDIPKKAVPEETTPEKDGSKKTTPEIPWREIFGTSDILVE